MYEIGPRGGNIRPNLTVKRADNRKAKAYYLSLTNEKAVNILNFSSVK